MSDFLHIELIKEDQMNIKLQGDPVIVAKMIATAMDSRQDIAAAMIAGVMAWCKGNNINPDNLKNMVKFH